MAEECTYERIPQEQAAEILENVVRQVEIQVVAQIAGLLADQLHAATALLEDIAETAAGGAPSVIDVE